MKRPNPFIYSISENIVSTHKKHHLKNTFKMVEADSNRDLDAKMLDHGHASPKTISLLNERVVRVMSVFQLLLAGALIYTLTTDGECEEPIRLWLKVMLISYIVSVYLAGLGCAKTLPPIVACGKLIFELIIVIWYIIGTVWFFQDDTCEVNWHTGYVMALVLVVFFFISLVIYSLCCLVEYDLW